MRPPQALYDRPANLFVAGFMGSPAMNLSLARVEASGDGVGLVLGGQRLALGPAARAVVRARAGRDVVVGIRPEALRPAGPAEDALDLPVVLTESLGYDLLVHAELDAPAVLTADQLELAREVGGDAAEQASGARG